MRPVIFRFATVLTAVCAAVLPLVAESSITGPSLGFVFDEEAQGIRRIAGLPGAAQLSEPLPLGVSLSLAKIAPGQEYALGLDADGRLLRIDLLGTIPTMRAMATDLASVDTFVISPTGSAAAVYDRRNRQAQMLGGMLATPEARTAVELGGLPGMLTALAVADDAGSMLAATAGRDGDGGLYRIDASGAARSLGSVTRVTSIRFVRGRDSAVAADYGRNEVLLATGLSEGGAVTTLATARDGVRGPAAVAADVYRERAIVAMPAMGRVALLPLDGGAAQFFDCRCRPTEVSPLRGRSLYQLTEDLRQPVILLDASPLAADGATLAPRAQFVPALAAEAPAGEEAPSRLRVSASR